MNPFAPTLILRRLQTALHLAHGMFYSIKKHQLTQLQARLYIFFDRSDMDITHNTDTRLCYKCHTVFLLHRLALSKLSFLSSSFEIGRSWKAARDKGHEWEHWLELRHYVSIFFYPWLVGGVGVSWNKRDNFLTRRDAKPTQDRSKQRVHCWKKYIQSTHITYWITNTFLKIYPFHDGMRCSQLSICYSTVEGTLIK